LKALDQSTEAAPSLAGEPSAVASGARDVDDIVRSLEADLAKERRRRRLRWALFIFLVLTCFAGSWAYRRATEPAPEARFTLAPPAHRDVIEKVQSTGIVEPVNKVEIGSQVSGRVVSVKVDFNDRALKGQLLAEIDPELFSAEVVQSKAQLDASRAALGRAQATRDAARIRRDRVRSLAAEAAASAAELDQAQADLDIAEAEVTSAAAQIAQLSARLNSASATLKYTKIYSPIDGVVIDRRVEPGQTVAASFNTPVLFVIARDLTQMRVLAEIDEADVGKVEAGMAVDVVVDAFPDHHFTGKLTQIRYSPTTVEGVVTYAAVVLVDNPEAKLRPGMTATATVETSAERGALAVRNAALRFEPLGPDDAAAAGKPGATAPAGTGEPKPLPKALGPGQGAVYVQLGGTPDNPRIERRVIQIGISDGVYTVVKGGLEAGAAVIVDEKVSETKRGFRLF
jgi:HlyD family secretion protein